MRAWQLSLITNGTVQEVAQPRDGGFPPPARARILPRRGLQTGGRPLCAGSTHQTGALDWLSGPK